MSAPSGGTIQQAWIGDAVLSLYIRSFILRERGRVDGELCASMTSNQFLGGLGEPTSVEAEIGRVYLASGLDASFAWIEAHLIPLFRRQEAKRLRKRGVGAQEQPSPRS